MLEMYTAQVNSPVTELKQELNSTDTTFEVHDASIFPEAPNLLTIGFNTPEPETVLLLEKNDNFITVERGFEGPQKNWTINTKIGRVFTAYDYNSVKYNIENFTPSEITGFNFFLRFIDSEFIYFVGVLENDWKVNRYDINNLKSESRGTDTPPSSLEECQGLIYEEV